MNRTYSFTGWELLFAVIGLYLGEVLSNALL